MKKIILLVLISILFLSVSLLACGKKVIKNDINVFVSDSKNNPLIDVDLTLDGKIGKTDSNGNYTFKQVEEGTYTLKASKDGYEEKSDNILVSEGKTQHIKIVLKEKVAFEEVKNYSELKSFKMVIEYKEPTSNINQKIEIIREDFGNKEYMKVVDLKTSKTQTEMVMDENKAKIRYEEKEWFELPRSEVQKLTEAFSSFAKEAVDNLTKDFNENIKTPEGSISYSINKIGSESINNYSTIKYLMKGKTKFENEQFEMESSIWIINSGEYKNYPTKFIYILHLKDGDTIYTINILEYGEAKVPEI